jgi:hypothetical protein
MCLLNNKEFLSTFFNFHIVILLYFLVKLSSTKFQTITFVISNKDKLPLSTIDFVKF